MFWPGSCCFCFGLFWIAKDPFVKQLIRRAGELETKRVTELEQKRVAELEQKREENARERDALQHEAAQLRETVASLREQLRSQPPARETDDARSRSAPRRGSGPLALIEACNEQRLEDAEDRVNGAVSRRKPGPRSG